MIDQIYGMFIVDESYIIKQNINNNITETIITDKTKVNDMWDLMVSDCKEGTLVLIDPKGRIIKDYDSAVDIR